MRYFRCWSNGWLSPDFGSQFTNRATPALNLITVLRFLIVTIMATSAQQHMRDIWNTGWNEDEELEDLLKLNPADVSKCEAVLFFNSNYNFCHLSTLSVVMTRF